MNLNEQIEEYLEAKKYSASTIGSHRSILMDFNSWQLHYPAMKMADKANGYDQFLRENCFRKLKTIEKQVGVVRRFCRWLEETGRVDAFRLDEHLLGRAEMRRVPKVAIGPSEIMKMLNVAAASTSDYALRDASMMLLAVTCGLTAAEISALNASSVFNLTTNDDLHYCGKTVEMPRVTSLVLKWYTREMRPRRGSEPLFAAGLGEDSERLSSKKVRECISALLGVVGCSYEEAVPGDCQLRIAQHFKNLDEGERRVAAARLQTMSYDVGKMPSGFASSLREKLVDRERRRPMLSVDGLTVSIVRDVR